MKNINRIFLILPFLCVFLVMSAKAQITSISQMPDVKPTDKHYQALQNLVERYGVIDGYPDGTFRAHTPLTRGEFAKVLNVSLERIGELVEASETEILNQELFNTYSANKTNITSLSQVKDIRPTNEYYTAIESLIERYGIDITDADKNFRPEKAITEKEFYTWIAGIFSGRLSGKPSATKAITRGEFAIVMSDALDALNTRIADLIEEKQATKPGSNNSTPQVLTKSKLEIIQSLPSTGKAKIVSKDTFYLPDNPCADLTNASQDVKTALEKGGIWGNYKMDKGDIGDIVFETNNTCRKGKLILLRVGTAIVTIGEKGVKRLK